MVSVDGDEAVGWGTVSRMCSLFGLGGSESVSDSGSEDGCPPVYGWSIVCTSSVIQS